MNSYILFCYLVEHLKKKIMRKILFILFIYLAYYPVYAKQYYFKHYNNENGLSNNTVIACLQDSRGFMWFGTKDGLNRFDGMQFKIYRTSSISSNYLINNRINTLCEDQDGCIWIGTSIGICYYDPSTDQFHTLPDNICSPGRISDIAVDLQNHIWFTTREGVYQYNKSNTSIQLYPTERYFPPRDIYITSNGEIWITSLNGCIYNFNKTSHTFQAYPILTPQELNKAVSLRKIIEIEQNNFIISTNNNGIRSFNPISGIVQTLFEKDKKGRILIINDMLVENEKEIWIGADNGLYKYHITDGLSEPINNIISDSYSLSDNGIRTLWKDKENGLWLGTFYGGINYLATENPVFEKYIPSSLPGHIQGNVIRAICADKSGYLWIGSEDRGLCRMNITNKTFTNYPFTYNIQGLLVDGNKLWIGTNDHGLYRMNIETGEIRPYFADKIKTKAIITFLKTSDNTIYIGSSTGIYQYIPGAEYPEYMSNFAADCFIHTLYEDSKGTIWAGTYERGLYSFNPGTEQLNHYTYKANNPNSISSNYITSIYEDTHGQLWVATEGDGLYKFMPPDSFVKYTTENGFPSAIICGICEDSKGVLWISSTRGLIRFNPENQHISLFSKNDGLTDNHFSYNATYIDATGRMYFGSINGMITFNPSDIKESNYTPPVFITEFNLLRNTKAIMESDKSILETKKVSLSYKNSSFNIGFVAPTYANPLRIKYRYLLEGYDKSWTYLSNYRNIYYTNVNPGKYILRVAVSNDSDNWNNETQLQIQISPPIFKSIGAYIIYSILSILLIYFVYIYYNKKKLQENQIRINEFENQKEKEIYNAKINFFTNITHEIRTPLALIKMPLDKIINIGNFPQSVTENLLIMKKNVDRLLNLVNQLLDFRKTEMDMLKLNFIYTDIIQLANTIISRFLPSAREKNISLHLYCPESSYFIAIDPEIITKIFSNLLTNGLKYSRDLIDICIEIPSHSESSLRIRFNSNGDLIPDEIREKIFKPFYKFEPISSTRSSNGTGIGLSLARSLAELHHGKLYLDTQERNMNSFILELPNNEKENLNIKERTTFVRENPTVELQNVDILRQTILIVDDEVEMAQYLANELSSTYNTFIASNGKVAIEIVREYKINLIISDIFMPVMDGYSFCKFIKSQIEYCHIPIILLTVSESLNSHIAGLDSGADGYLEKPFDIELLLGLIANIFKNKELACENFIRSPFSNYKAITISKIDDDFMKRLHINILNNISEPTLNVEELARMMHTSTSTLYRKVKDITGISPNEYIRVYRLKKAAEMLSSTEYKINEISYLVGFSSPSYFTTSFQKQFNISPSQFINQQKTIKHINV
jgi:ligand-binding sensor domain-containing protein/signal transduction histidine kinase/DNA-binding response OmpR family regulator